MYTVCLNCSANKNGCLESCSCIIYIPKCYTRTSRYLQNHFGVEQVTKASAPVLCHSMQVHQLMENCKINTQKGTCEQVYQRASYIIIMRLHVHTKTTKIISSIKLIRALFALLITLHVAYLPTYLLPTSARFAEHGPRAAAPTASPTSISSRVVMYRHL